MRSPARSATPGDFGDDVLAAAVLDRLLHHAHTLMIQGDSYRLKNRKKAGLVPASKE